MSLSKIINRNEFFSRDGRPILLIYAKATTEWGNLGATGNLFCNKLKKEIPGKVAVQGVHYGELSGCLSLIKRGSTSAAREVVDFVEAAKKRNPETKIFLCGYSQGAMIIRKAVRKLSAESRKGISGIILFGDALKILGGRMPRDVMDKTLNKRLIFDWSIIGFVTVTHFLYPFVSYGEAARFIRDRAGV